MRRPTLVVDASVAVKWILPEDGHEEAIPSALARSYPGLLTKSDPPKRPFGAGQMRGLDAKESPPTGSREGYKHLARLRRG